MEKLRAQAKTLESYYHQSLDRSNNVTEQYQALLEFWKRLKDSMPRRGTQAWTAADNDLHVALASKYDSKNAISNFIFHSLLAWQSFVGSNWRVGEGTKSRHSRNG